jgi:hypothetical protein
LELLELVDPPEVLLGADGPTVVEEPLDPTVVEELLAAGAALGSLDPPPQAANSTAATMSSTASGPARRSHLLRVSGWVLALFGIGVSSWDETFCPRSCTTPPVTSRYHCYPFVTGDPASLPRQSPRVSALTPASRPERGCVEEVP